MISLIYGTRPEFLKIKPLIEKLKRDNVKYKIIKINQQKDLCSNFEKDVEISIDDNGCSRLNSMFSILPNLEKEIKNSKYVIVHGDTATSLVAAICSFNLNIPVIHLEAGLRTYDKQNPYPEECYRQIISSISDIHLCPTVEDKNNLLNEGKTGKIFITGNTVLDNLVDQKYKGGNQVLITLHRRENHEKINSWIESIEDVSKEYPDFNFIFIKHPNPIIQNSLSKFKNVKIIEPLPYDELIENLKTCKFVITDSGGLQEECSWFNVKTVVCRKCTERKQSIGKNSILCYTPENLSFDIKTLLKLKTDNIQPCPYGDGNSSDRILKIIKDIL